MPPKRSSTRATTACADDSTPRSAAHLEHLGARHPVATDALRDLGERRPGQVHERDTRALLAEQLTGRRADAAGAPGDDSHLAVESFHGRYRSVRVAE
jgi:hypothetical protein